MAERYASAVVLAPFPVTESVGSALSGRPENLDTIMRVALFGGTFDPPHCGHIAIARAAADAFALDTILFAPTGLQPLKLENGPTPFATRVALVEQACKEDIRFSTSRIDAPHPDGTPNYTVDTLAALGVQFPGAALFNLVGADSFLSLRSWRGPDRLLALAEWIVVTRPGYLLSESSLTPLALTPAQRNRVHILAGVEQDISATSLRERLHRGDPCTALLPFGVSTYISKHGLYS